MASLDEEIRLDEEENRRELAFIRTQLPPTIKKFYSDKDILYMMDLIVDYYFTSGILESDEEEIDISEEAMMFSPVMIEKDGKEKSLVASVASELSRMTGGIEMDQLVPMLNELAEKGENSVLGGLVNDWNEYEQAA